MKLKAEIGHYSSIVGNSVHLLDQDERMVGQVAILCHTDDLRGEEIHERLCKIICEAINSKEDDT